MTEAVKELNDDEAEAAQTLWHDLKYGAPDAHERFAVAPENIKAAILGALVRAMDKRKKTSNPFADH